MAREAVMAPGRRARREPREVRDGARLLEPRL
jgi:hypothetical protein